MISQIKRCLLLLYILFYKRQHIWTKGNVVKSFDLPIPTKSKFANIQFRMLHFVFRFQKNGWNNKNLAQYEMSEIIFFIFVRMKLQSTVWLAHELWQLLLLFTFNTRSNRKENSLKMLKNIFLIFRTFWNFVESFENWKILWYILLDFYFEY